MLSVMVRIEIGIAHIFRLARGVNVSLSPQPGVLCISFYSLQLSLLLADYGRFPVQ